MLVQFRVFYLTQSLARDDHDVQPGKQLLVKTKGIAHQALEAVALNGELDALLADHQAETRVIETVLASKDQQVFPGTLPVGESKTALKCRGVSSRFSRLKS